MKQSSKGVPKNLRALAEQGERIRFNGGWLTDSPRDRVIARWLDEHPRGAWAVIKELLYHYITGKFYFRGNDRTERVDEEEQSSFRLGEGASALSELDT